MKINKPSQLPNPAMSIPVVEVANLEQFKAHLTNLHFRRISSVRVDGHIINHVFFEDDETYTEYTPGQLPEEIRANKNYYEQHVENYATHFTCMTAKNALRDNDRISVPIFVSSQNMYEFNHLSCTFDQKVNGPRLVPYTGALIAGVVNFDNKGRPFFERWAQVSDQFLRCMTLVVYGEDHPAITSLCHEFTNGETESVARAMMRGNTLAVSNNVQKERLAREHSGVEPMTLEEVRKRYARTHNEWINRAASHIHWYNLIALLCVYKEAPCEYNVPNNIRGNKLNSWIFPEEDKNYLYEYLGVKVVGEKSACPQAPRLDLMPDEQARD